MTKVTAELPAAELPESLARLIPGGAIPPGTQVRVTLELLGGDASDDEIDGWEIEAIGVGLREADAGAVVGEEALFQRLLRKSDPA